MISLFIVDDHYMVVEGIRSMLDKEPGIDWLGHASGAETCLSFLLKKQPDIILMDINMPGMSGIELCAEVVSLYPAVHVIALSTFSQASYINKMLGNGADGYLLKNASKEEMLEAFAVVMKGKKHLSFEAASSVRGTTDEALPLLTRREKEVLELIAEGLTNGEIAERLFVSVTTVDSHRKNLLAKLNARNVAALVKIAMTNKLI